MPAGRSRHQTPSRYGRDPPSSEVAPASRLVNTDIDPAVRRHLTVPQLLDLCLEIGRDIQEVEAHPGELRLHAPAGDQGFVVPAENTCNAEWLPIRALRRSSLSVIKTRYPRVAS